MGALPGGEPDAEIDLDHRRMAAGADGIDDLDVIRSGGMKQVFGGVNACATLEIFLRESTHGLSTVQRRHLIGLARQTQGAGGHR